MDWAVTRPRDGSPSSLVLVGEAARRLGGPRAAFASLTIHCQAMPSRGSAFSVAPLGAMRSMPHSRSTRAPGLWSKGRRFEMTETLAPPVVPAAEERARLKEGVHIERSSRRVRTYFGKKLIADSE